MAVPSPPLRGIDRAWSPKYLQDPHKSKTAGIHRASAYPSRFLSSRPRRDSFAILSNTFPAVHLIKQEFLNKLHPLELCHPGDVRHRLGGVFHRDHGDDKVIAGFRINGKLVRGAGVYDLHLGDAVLEVLPLILLDDDPRRGDQQRPPFGGGAVLGEGEVKGEGDQLLLVGADPAKLPVKCRLLFDAGEKLLAGFRQRQMGLGPGAGVFLLLVKGILQMVD